MKQYDLEYGGGGGVWYGASQSIPYQICCSCQSQIGSDEKSYVKSEPWYSKVFGKKGEKNIICKECHRDSVISDIV